MKINLLIKIQVGLRSLAFARETRVINTGAVGVPGRAAAGSRILHMRNRIRRRPARRRFVNVQGSIFAPALRNRNRDIFSVTRRYKPIDRRCAFSIERVRVQHHLLRFQIVGRHQRHQHLLLLRRLKFHREQDPGTRNQPGITWRSFGKPIGQLFLNRRPVG